MGRDDVKLVLGYNTAVLNLLLLAARRRIVMNMDGLEWRRAKWGPLARLWLRGNESVGARSAHWLVADHPGIERHLQAVNPRAQIRMIPYGADRVDDLDHRRLDGLGIGDRPFLVVVARIEPENSIFEIVSGFSQAPMAARLVVLGSLDPERNAYHARVLAAASDECVFLGAIYDATVVSALRAQAVAYVHGHTVGGTNPSLVEALGAGAAVVAHDNPFNRWVAGDAAVYFRDEGEFRAAALTLLGHPELRSKQRASAIERHAQAFQWCDVLDAYADLLAAEWARRGRA
jgi:glycosyltransferase involved in cell wall biosynthesis